MNNYAHTFHIPVMGTGHSADTPIRVAPFGISSVISLVDDLLLEKIRKYYSREYSLPYVEIARSEEGGRAKRITAYLETIREIVRIKMETIKSLPFFETNDKAKYFELLPDESPLKRDYNRLLKMRGQPGAHPKIETLENDLTRRMQAGSIDVNIMVKLDRVNFDRQGQPLGDEFTDAKAAFKGYAESALKSAIVFSAGMNQSLFSYITRFKDFYRDKCGEIKKKIILKVSDFRSALIQGKFLAKKGLEIYEFRIESGLNCGGHAFASNGALLPSVLREFKEKRDHLAAQFFPLILKYYKSRGWKYPSGLKASPIVSVQGGIGHHGEVRRLREDFDIDLTGWASPFLLVPEATCVDAPTRELLRQADEDDFYMSDASPLGVTFNNVRNSGSDIWTRRMAAEGRPGSSCPKGFLVSNTEFTKWPICLASRQFQKRKLEEIAAMDFPAGEKERLRQKVLGKSCICHHLGNGALIALGIADEPESPPAICPGPNLAWFKQCYTLKEMVDHIYGRGPSLVPENRPHMFASEVVMYVDYFEKQVAQCSYTPREIKTLKEFKNNIEDSLDFCLDIAKRQPFQGENLASIPPVVERQRSRLRFIYADFEEKMNRRGSSFLKEALCQV